jgi:hypothetical protein
MIKPVKITMTDVATRAGVSPATVARVLYENGYVSKKKRAIVRAALVETGYRPNVMARALRTAGRARRRTAMSSCRSCSSDSVSDKGLITELPSRFFSSSLKLCMVSSILLAGPGVNQFFDSRRRTSTRDQILSLKRVRLELTRRDGKDGALMRESSNRSFASRPLLVRPDT